MPPKDFVPTVLYAITDDNEAIEIGNCKTVEELTAQFERWDFVRVTRCKDCKHGLNTEIGKYCGGAFRTGDWFCADGEPKEGADADN